MTEVSYLRKMTSCGCRDLAGDTPPRRYQIIVSGHLGMASREAFRDLQIDPHGTDTALTADLNRSGLHELLARIRELGLDLAGLTCLAPGRIVQRLANLRTSRGPAIHADRESGW